MVFDRFFRRRRLENTANQLGLALRNRFGERRYYRPADVYSTAAMIGIPAAMLGMGLAWFCTRQDFEEATQGLPGSGDYDALRSEFLPADRYDPDPINRTVGGPGDLAMTDPQADDGGGFGGGGSDAGSDGDAGGGDGE